MKKTLADKIVAAILKELNGRKGFDYWWHEIDKDTKKEITDTLKQKVGNLLMEDWLESKPSRTK